MNHEIVDSFSHQGTIDRKYGGFTTPEGVLLTTKFLQNPVVRPGVPFHDVKGNALR